MNKYPNSGTLSVNKYKKEQKHPDMTGQIIMERAILKQLMAEHDDDDIVIKLSAYKIQGAYGEFLSVRWNPYKKAEEQPAQRPAQQPIDDSDVPF